MLIYGIIYGSISKVPHEAVMGSRQKRTHRLSFNLQSGAPLGTRAFWHFQWEGSENLAKGQSVKSLRDPAGSCKERTDQADSPVTPNSTKKKD